MMSKWAFILTVAAGVAGGATSASAITFDLTSDHCTGGCGTAPFGTVDVTQVGANVHIVVDLANGPPNTVSWAQTGAADFQLFKFNATGVVVGDISVVQTFAGQYVAGKHRNLQRGRHREFQFRDQLHHLRERGSWDRQQPGLHHC